uniref:Uncharacterized protein n=1 Tax=viral metagenome TaxID=1070528 RepID=A0A6C0F3X1_9ZZZZ
MPRKSRVSKKHTRRRKARGGYYGFNGAVGTGAADWRRGSEAGDYAAGLGDRGGNSFPLTGGRKRRGSRKGSRRVGRKTRRGGGKFGGVSASYTGEGSKGLISPVAIVTRDGSGAAAEGAFNNNGAQPGSGFGSFVRAH